MNPRPSDYKSDALPTELRQRSSNRKKISEGHFDCKAQQSRPSREHFETPNELLWRRNCTTSRVGLRNRRIFCAGERPQGKRYSKSVSANFAETNRRPRLGAREHEKILSLRKNAGVNDATSNRPLIGGNCCYRNSRLRIARSHFSGGSFLSRTHRTRPCPLHVYRLH